MTRLRTSDTGLEGQDRPQGVPEGAIVSVFRVPPESSGMRLDVFLQHELKRTSRTRTQFIIRNSAFDVNGKRLRANHRVRAEEHVLLWRAPWDEDPVPTDVPVLYEDRATARAIHALKVEKYAVARGAAAIGLYSREARDTTVALRLDPCPGG